MTLGKFMSQMGIAPKHLTERFSHGDYGGGGGHDSHLIYSYEPSHPSHQHVATSKHHYGGGGHKSNTAMSALTLLAFLFFLNILQQCLRDHMMAMSTTPVVIMTGGREGEEPISKTTINKMDKAGKSGIKSRLNDENNENLESKNDKDVLMKINTAEHTPKIGAPKYTKVYKNYGNRSLEYRGFVNAMDADYN